MAETFVTVRLIPKAQGGLRPIALFRSWFRLLAACQREEVRKWVDTVPDIGINMRPGRKVGDSTYRLQVRESLGLGDL